MVKPFPRNTLEHPFPIQLILLACRLLLIAFMLALVDRPVFAQTSTTNTYDRPGRVQAATIHQTAPTATDELFVSGEGGNLDTYLFREDVADGLLRFEIPITRFFSAKTNDISTLVATGVLPETAKLILRAYDVDESASPCPERDYIFVNGNLLQQNDTAVHLTGANDTWSAVQYDVPIEFLRFPTAPGTAGTPPVPAMNDIAIQINAFGCVPNNDPTLLSSWAVEVDWGAIEIKEAVRPFMMAHGWTGTPAAFDHFAQLMHQQGLPFADAVDLENGIQPLAHSGNLLANAITQTLIEFGVEKVNLLGHSKGGVVIRQALLSSATLAKAQTVTTFGSPHHGVGGGNASELFSDLQCDFTFATGAQRRLCKAAAAELTRDAMRAFNYTGCQRNLLQGWQGCTLRFSPPQTLEFRTFIIDYDQIGTREQATYPWRADARPFPTTGSVDAEFACETSGVVSKLFNCHSELLQRADTFCRAVQAAHPQLELPICASTAQSSLNSAFQQPDPAQIQESYVTNGMLTAGATETFTLSVEATEFAYIQLRSISEPTNVVLIDSDGVQVAPGDRYGTTVTASYDPVYGWLAEYRIPMPIAGTWQVQLASTTTTPYVASVSVLSSLMLTSAVSQFANQSGEVVYVEAALVDEVTLAATQQLSTSNFLMTVDRPDGQSITMLMVDDGTTGDHQAGDGIFTAAISDTSATGLYVVHISADTASGQQRYSSNTLVVTDQQATLGTAVNEEPVDLDGDTLFDELVLNVPVFVTTTGHYQLLGTLVTPSGQAVVNASYSTRIDGGMPVGTGEHQLALRFDGATIRNTGLDGPYTLTNVVLQGENQHITHLEQRNELFVTIAYSARQFEGEGFSLQQISEQVYDDDGNGRYDRLDLQLMLDFVTSGDFEINGRLVTASGEEIGWSQTTLNVTTSGLYTVTLSYPGELLGVQQANGPYILTDLNFFASGTGTTNDLLEQVYTTSPYHFTEFEGGFYYHYLPLLQAQAPIPPPPPCVPNTPQDANNVSDASVICYGQIVTGQVNTGDDRHDVYAIWLEQNRPVVITLTGIGVDSDLDLYLYAPDTQDVTIESPFAYSVSLTNDESLEGSVPFTGYWYVDAYAFSGAIEYTLQVNLIDIAQASAARSTGEITGGINQQLTK